MLRLDGLSVGYGGPLALQDLSLEVRDGELVSLIGANGAGKSTTLKAISGLLKPQAGRITWGGEAIGGLSPRAVIARGIAHCPEGRRVFPQLSVRENLDCFAGVGGLRGAAKAERIDTCIGLGQLQNYRSVQAQRLSGGEQQMLAIARALMSRPRLVMFDEPSLGLAPSLVEQVFAIVREIRAKGTTVLMVEQNAMAALQMADRAYLLEAGQLVQAGTGAELLASPEVRAAYLGG